MKIGILGAGNIGSTLARKLSAAGHNIRLANSRGPDSIAELAQAVGATAMSAAQVVKDIDALIMSVPLAKVPALGGLFVEMSDDVIVADTSNYYPHRDGHIPALDDGQAESIWVSEQIGRPVLKAWNSVSSGTLATAGLPAGAKGRIALPVSGNDLNAKRIIISLVDATGFDGIDAGTIEESWRQQPGSPAYGTNLDIDDLRRALSAADKSRNSQLRDLAIEKLKEIGFDRVKPEQIEKIYRSITRPH